MIRIIVNGNARPVQTDESRADFVEKVAHALTDKDAVVWFSGDSASIDQLAERAVRDGATIIVAGGGDGTINSVASVVVGTDRVLGVLPLGTLNHFAKDLGIPSEIDAALGILANGVIREVDAGQVNERIFLNNSGLGLYPDIVHQREIRQKHGASKWPAAVASAVRALRRYRVLAIRVTADGQAMLRRTPAVLVGNNEYTTEGGLEPKRVSLDSGKLSLYMPRSRGPVQLLWFSLRALFRGPKKASLFDVLLTDAFTIESRHEHLRVSLDGEVTIMKTPLEYRSLAAALKVLVPAAVS